MAELSSPESPTARLRAQTWGCGAMGRSRLALVLVATVVAFFSLAVPSWAQTVTKSNTQAAEVAGGSAERGVSFTSADFPASSTVTNVVVALDFAHIDDTGTETNPTCGPPPVNGTLNERNDELGYDLRSPGGTTVSLIAIGTYTASPFGGRVAVTLDDTAALPLSGVPSSGTFRPSGQLSTFDGELAGGTWTLVAKDDFRPDPLCHYGFSLTLTAETPPNQAPVASDDAYSTAEDTVLSVAAPGVLANDSDPDGDALAATLVAGPTHGALTLNADGSFSYTPAANYNGPDSFSYKASDGSLDSNTATVNLTVNAVNDAPTVTVGAGGACGANDRSGTINLTVADVDNAAAGLTLSGASSNQALVPNAGLVFGGAGASRTLTATAASRATGTATITVTVSDGSATGTVTVTIRASGNGKDTLAGTGGADMLFGQNGKDTLDGQAGNDLLCGGRGKDRLTGSTGADHFGGGPGTDTAADITAAQGDTQDGTIP